MGMGAFGSGCEALREASRQNFEAMEAIREQVEAEFGVTPSIKIQRTYFEKNVGIALPEQPAGDRDAIEARIEAIVREHIPDASRVVVMM